MFRYDLRNYSRTDLDPNLRPTRYLVDSRNSVALVGAAADTPTTTDMVGAYRNWAVAAAVAVAAADSSFGRRRLPSSVCFGYFQEGPSDLRTRTTDGGRADDADGGVDAAPAGNGDGGEDDERPLWVLACFPRERRIIVVALFRRWPFWEDVMWILKMSFAFWKLAAVVSNVLQSWQASHP